MNFALAGNPNSGKTTLFNALTGSTAYVGNWPGVTVDKREGVYKKLAEPVGIVDLPGIYSLSPYTPEEIVSRNYVLDEKPDCIINVVDATNLERNLYLTTQLKETSVPIVVALNMIDEVESAGDKADAEEIEKNLGVPVVPVSALLSRGISELMKRAYEAAKKGRAADNIFASTALGGVIGELTDALKAENVSDPLFHAIKLLEKDELEVGKFPAADKRVDLFRETFSDKNFGNDCEAFIADARYKYISENFSHCYKRNRKTEKLTKSDKADKVLTHRIFGIPIFLAVMFVIFHLTFSENFLFLNGFGEGWMPALFESAEKGGLGWEENAATTLLACFYDGAVFSPGVILTNLLNWALEWINVLAELCCANAPLWVGSFVVDGILGGLLAVLGFLPQILTLFLFFSILEDSGYMARVAFLLDRIFRKFGLSGKAFMPMIMGFGCSIPAMINTRTLADEKERVSTVRVIPFFSCGAKLPILTAIAGGIVSFFGVGNADVITYSMYLLGIVTAIVAVILMRSTTMRGEIPPFIMELPSYRMPRFSSLMIHLWDKTKHFIKKAFTIILASTILIWFLSSFSPSWQFLLEEGEDGLVNLRMNESILGAIGMIVQPLFTPLGFGSQLGSFGWVFAIAAITGLVAKENVIATFGTLAAAIAGALVSTEDGVLETVTMISATGITIPGLIAFIAFNMTTIPCFAACATAKGELKKGTFKWTVLFWIVTSYVVGTVVYLVGSWWWTVFLVAALIAAAVVGIIFYNRRRDRLAAQGILPQKRERKKKIRNCCGDCSACKGHKD